MNPVMAKNLKFLLIPLSKRESLSINMIFVVFFEAVSSVKSIRLNLKPNTFYLVFGIKKYE